MTAAEAAQANAAAVLRRGRHRRRYVVVAAAVAVCAAVAVVVTGAREIAGSSGEVRFPGGQDFGISLPSTQAGQAYSIGNMFLCLADGTTRAVVDDIRPAHAAGIRVDAFGTRPGPSRLGAEPITLVAAGFPTNARTVTGACSAERGSEVGVQLSKAGSGDARLDGLSVSWHTGSAHGTTLIPLHLVLCAGADQNAPDCIALR